ncbi:hypothetical protein QTO34_009892 [Cnephaeus nilssonii]|uniref:SH3 domain-containing protein n=1 Tax=Cnephaeus nilssonii TaxID=3371016 RepID=A0AA40HEB9_CNENI|nr:hypothetical protein QTO34_009892 [Eptesicus nilssonii]
MADVSQYPVNHLVTFCLGEEDGVHTVEDAARKLAVMDSQGRVWAQEMLLRVSPDHVTLLDHVSKEELESYPLSAILRCDAVTPPGRSRSLLLLVCQEPERAQPDVHFFQGLRLGAELMREDIQGALHNYRSGHGDRRAAALRATEEELQRRPAPAAETPPLQRRPSIRAVISPAESATARERPQTEPILEEEAAPRPGRAETPRSADPASPDLGPRGPDLAGLQAERDVDILNHVFDDVESFVSKLQKSAEAARVLEHRERGRRTRRREAGEGLLALRAKPPSEAEYTDVLQKIKYAFSLLARLRGNIANPSSPELLHFLFGPLHVIVEMSGGPQLASGVRRPHLTSEAVALLRENVTPSENALWTSLGDSWTRPGCPRRRDPHYSPSSTAAGSPRPLTRRAALGGPSRKTAAARAAAQAAKRPPDRCQRDPESEAEPQPEPQPAGKWVLCNYDFQARNSSELSVKHRDVLEVLDDNRKWWKVRDQRGQEGYVPYNILTPHPGPRRSRSPSPARTLVSRADPRVWREEALGNPILGPGNEGWWVESRARRRRCLGVQDLISIQRGWDSDVLPLIQLLSSRSSPGEQHSPAPTDLGPSPGPAGPAPVRPHWDSCDSLNSLDPGEKEKFCQMLSVNEELQARLAQGRSGPSRTATGPRAPEPQLHPRSDASEDPGDALGVLTGAQIFSLQKEEFRAVSPEEGARVYSQVTVQRALLEDKENVSELEAVMEKQKKKVEGEMETEVI